MTAKLLLASALVLGMSGQAPLSHAQDLSSSPRGWRQPCLSPIKYRIGTLDPRFGITRENFQRHVEEAAKVWGAAAGRKLFSQDDRGPLEIDLVYDSRQEATQRLVAARASISEKLKEADLVRDQMLPLQDKFRVLDDSYSSQLSSYQRDLAAYNTVVTQSNKREGILEGEQQQLRSESLALRKREALLEATRQELNRLVGDINALVKKHNTVLDRANAEANALNKSVGITFEQGQYVKQAGEGKIQIFEYEDETALVAILAHEMGHAIGVGHNANPSSIMSPLVHTRTPVLTADDMDGLRTACSLR